MKANVVCGLLLLALSGCASTTITTIASSPSAAPSGGTGHLLAGFSRVDITPPPGAGLMGYGTEGKQSRGYRMRLYARALVLEDPAGERIAFVLADLVGVSALLQRKVAELVRDSTGIGADRLIISATHTHSAPGHWNGAPAYDEQGSVVAGFDSALVTMLARGMADAVLRAFDERLEARAAWGFTTLWNETRVRAEPAMQRNPDRFMHPSATAAPLPADPRYRYSDPQISMLRVDVRAGNRFRPAGSFIIFPVHGTFNPGANQLMDGDLHSIVMRELEQRIAPGPHRPDTRPGTIHLFANGAEGDITPDFTEGTRCPAPAPRVTFVPTGPRRPSPPDNFRPVRAPPFPQCLQQSRAEAYRTGIAIANAVAELHDNLGLAVAQPAAGDLRIARTFAVLSASVHAEERLPCKPHAGPETTAGTEGGYTRLLNVPLFRTIIGLDTVPRPDTTLPARDACRGGKKNIDLFENVVTGSRPFPYEMQLTVVRLGDVTIGTIPGEPTTNAGARMRRTMASDSMAGFSAIYEKHLILGLANGYNSYITTPYEYTAQLYEGAVTLYGPYTAEVVAQKLGQLARALPAYGQPSPPVDVKPITIATRSYNDIVPRPSERPPRIDARQRSLLTCWRADTLVARWTDQPPGDLQPAAGALLQVERRAGSDTMIVTWDDDPFLEVWHLRGNGAQAEWEMRYAPLVWQTGAFRVVLRQRGSLPAVIGTWVTHGRPHCRPNERFSR